MIQLLIKYGNIVLTTTTGHRVRYHLYLLLLVRQAGYIVNLSDFYSYRLIGKLTVFLFFFLSFLFVPNSLFKKETLAKSSLLNTSENHENSFLNRCGIKHDAIFSGHIGAGYREIQEIGVHRRDLETMAGTIGCGKNTC
jgi:hypothetical protein